MTYSFAGIVRQGLAGNRGWKPMWREPDPKPEYDVVIIGGGGHGLSTAHYLAKEHGLTNVAVLEKGYIGSGNVGRNTTIVRANYLLPGNSEFYSHSLRLWEQLETDLNYNVMHSQRGLFNLFHSDAQRDAAVRRGNAMINRTTDAHRAWTAAYRIVQQVTLSACPSSRDNVYIGPIFRDQFYGRAVKFTSGTRPCHRCGGPGAFARSADGMGGSHIRTASCDPVPSTFRVNGRLRGGFRRDPWAGSRSERCAMGPAKAGRDPDDQVARQWRGCVLRSSPRDAGLWCYDGPKPFVHAGEFFGRPLFFYISSRTRADFVFGGDNRDDTLPTAATRNLPLDRALSPDRRHDPECHDRMGERFSPVLGRRFIGSHVSPDGSPYHRDKTPHRRPLY